MSFEQWTRCRLALSICDVAEGDMHFGELLVLSMARQLKSDKHTSNVNPDG